MLVFLFFIAVICFVIAPSWSVKRHGEQDSLLGALGVAVEKGMPLEWAVRALADTYWGRKRRRLLQLADLLGAGVSLPDALDRTPALLPLDTRVAAGVGWETGNLVASFHESQAARALLRPAEERIHRQLIYMGALLFVIQGPILYLLTFIAPKLRKIFSDFGQELPSLTVMTLDQLSPTGEMGWMILLPIGVIVVVALGCLNWFPSLRRRLRFSPHRGVLLRCLAMMLQSKRELPGSIAALSQSYPPSPERRGLRYASDQIARGNRWWTALYEADLIGKADAAVLESAERAGNLPWALRTLAQQSDARARRRLEFWSNVLAPMGLIALGGLVAVLAISYFLPLTMLISNLAKDSTP